MAPEPAIRLATPDDAEALAALLADFRDFYGDRTPTDEQFRQAVDGLVEDPATEFLLAGEPPFGFAALRYRPSVWTDGGDAWLEDLFVSEHARRSGVGRALVEASVERARQRGCGRVQLDSNERNTAAIALYESLGFSATSPTRWGEGRNLCLTRRL